MLFRRRLLVTPPQDEKLPAGASPHSSPPGSSTPQLVNEPLPPPRSGKLGGARLGAGRPKLPNEERRSGRMPVYLAPGDLPRFERARASRSERSGEFLSFSSWALEVLREECSRVEGSTRKAKARARARTGKRAPKSIKGAPEKGPPEP